MNLAFMDEMISKVLLEFNEDPYGVRHRLSFFANCLKDYSQELNKIPLVLEVGCGTGELISIPLAKMGFPVVGIDIHEPSIRRGRQIAENYGIRNVTLCLKSIDELIQMSLEFDAVICSEVLEHLEDPASMLRKIALITKPSGMALITVPNGQGPFEIASRLYAIYFKSVRPFIKPLKSRLCELISYWSQSKDFAQQCEPCSSGGTLNLESRHIQFFSWQSINSLFESTGWRVERYMGRSFICGPLLDMIVNAVSFGKDLNVMLGKRLPPFVVSGWMFQLRKFAEN
jgi:SAM-dependent methyltransferase